MPYEALKALSTRARGQPGPGGVEVGDESKKLSKASG